MLPFRRLLKPGTPFEWNDRLDDLFDNSKSLIIDDIRKGVEIFDKSKPTCLATDWSKDGIGFWLSQKHCNCSSRDPFCCRTGWKVTLVGSRFTSAAESRYAPVEGEALAVIDALDRSRHFVLGCHNLIVAVDHNTLLKIFSDRSLDDIPNPRLRNLKEKSLRYRFRIVHVPSARHAVADAVSRHQVSPAEPPYQPDDIASSDQSLTTSSNITKPGQYATSTPTHQICVQSAPAPEIIKSITWDDIRVATASVQTDRHHRRWISW